MSFYDVETQAEHRRLSITFHKHMWTMDEIPPFAARCRDAVDKLLRVSDRYRTLIHFKECHIQSQQIFAVMDAMVKGSSAERIALVADNPLARMQTKRLASSGRVRFFDDIPSSLAWLDDMATAMARTGIEGGKEKVRHDRF